eukprot:COSAG02_NODE_3504_length_6638_cov_2.198043_1_plen_93_part_10
MYAGDCQLCTVVLIRPVVSAASNRNVRDSLADSHTQNLPGRCGGSWRIGLPAAVSERHTHREPRRSAAPCPLTDAETVEMLLQTEASTDQSLG